jgi:uncharacterized OsmC-like protein
MRTIKCEFPRQDEHLLQGQSGSPAAAQGAEAAPLEAGQVEVSETGEGRFANLVRVGRHRLLADEPLAAGGGDRGPSPYDYLLAALGTCTAMTLRVYAEQKKWPLAGVTVRLNQQRIHAQDCADCESGSGHVTAITREIALAGELSAEQRAKLLEIAEKCPVHRTLTGEIKIRTRLRDPGS